MHTNSMRSGLAAALLVTIAIGTGCGSGASGASSTTPTTAPRTTMPTVTSGASTSAPASSDRITIKNFAFGTPITVKPGATVTVFNDGDQTHTLSADDNASFDTGPIIGGKTVTFVAPMQPGTYEFHCNIHDMHGALRVVA